MLIMTIIGAFLFQHTAFVRKQVSQQINFPCLVDLFLA